MHRYEDVYQEARSIGDSMQSSLDPKASWGDVRYEFHIGTLFGRIFRDSVFVSVLDGYVEPKRYRAAYSLFKGYMADVVASLPDVGCVADANTGQMVDPLAKLKNALPGGERKKDFPGLLVKISEIEFAISSENYPENTVERDEYRDRGCFQAYIRFLDYFMACPFLVVEKGMGPCIVAALEKFSLCYYQKSKKEVEEILGRAKVLYSAESVINS